MKITLSLFNAASPNPAVPIGKITMDIPEGKYISDIAKEYMSAIYKGDPFIEEVVHDDGRKTRMCFSKTTDHFLAWNLAAQESETAKVEANTTYQISGTQSW